jgi:hypothetical protein
MTFDRTKYKAVEDFIKTPEAEQNFPSIANWQDETTEYLYVQHICEMASRINKFVREPGDFFSIELSGLTFTNFQRIGALLAEKGFDVLYDKYTPKKMTVGWKVKETIDTMRSTTAS